MLTVDVNKIKFACSLLLCVCLVACGVAEPEVKARTSSPGGTLDAVIVEWPTNATSGRSYGFYLVRKGAPLKEDGLYIAGSGIIADSVKWTGDGRVQVEYLAGTLINRFSNIYFSSPAQDRPPEKVEILLIRRG